jgi:hypothetical protein
MDRPNVFWLDGSITLNGTDAGTISSADGPVEFDEAMQQIVSAGSRGVPLHMDEVLCEPTITINDAFIDMRMLEHLNGMAPSYGYLEDGLTPSKNYSRDSNCNSIIRPYAELLVTGNKHGTENPLNGNLPYRLEIWAARAKLSGAFSLGMSKANFTKVKLVFKLFALSDKSSIWLQFRDEEMQS